MFCPQCKSEYRPGFTRCADCGVDLVDRLPEEPRDIHKEMLEIHNRSTDDVRLVPVLQTEDQSDVVSIKMVLDSEEVEYILQGETLMGFRRGDPVVLLVREDDVARVKELLSGINLNYSSQMFNPKKRH